VCGSYKYVYEHYDEQHGIRHGGDFGYQRFELMPEDRRSFS
jgi:hypothetical protein